MAEALKDIYTKGFINNLASALQSEYPQFDVGAFNKAVFDSQWQAKTLKQRIRHIAESLKLYLPEDFNRCVDILIPVSKLDSGYAFLFFPEFVALYGLHDFSLSMIALEKMTEYASAEFAIRPFILNFPEQAMDQILKWTKSPNHHVRRLASEGCRPRLPWADALTPFKRDPAPIIAVLENLKEDNSEYVRRSVANNLNDISKDHPQQVLAIAGRWLGSSRNTDRLVKHACRTLLKQGDEQALALFGLGLPGHITVKVFDADERVLLGDSLSFSFDLLGSDGSIGFLRIEYGIDFLRSNGQHYRKLFKISEAEFKQQCRSFTKKHSFKPISTRRYYPGKHRLAIILNGKEMAIKTFDLLG